MIQRPFDALFFDIDGTLLDFKLAERRALERVRSFMNSSLSSKDFREAYHKINAQLWEELEQGGITGGELKEERFRRFSAALQSKEDPQELSAFYLQRLGEESHFLAGAEEVIRKLSPGYPMGIITNGLTQVQEARCGRPEIQDHFQSIVISEKAGTAKPSAEIFRLAAEGMGISLSKRVLMIGDSLTSDIAGGINAGISTCWYNPGQWENQSPWEPDFEIHDLQELTRIVRLSTAENRQAPD